MPELINVKYEAIARALAKGASQLKACRSAGSNTKSRSNAYRMCSRPEIQARVRELTGDHDKLRAARESIRQDSIKKSRTGSAVTTEYLLLELQDQLAQARAKGNVREGLNCIKLMALVSGSLRKGTGNPPGRPKTKQRQEQEALSDVEGGADDDAIVDGGTTEISALDNLIGRLDRLSGDDAEERVAASLEDSDSPDGDDKDRGPSRTAKGPDGDQRTD